ncbi:hypothetical protein G5I_02394 [Acromyrmex echinatior]|uniref:Uncharacterized protein n=1 Tax=Acromyrmex echinatior TaxID=103372 RepID=F4WA73_ACREC|nr:hypothetical protein G5I_02394 [Acromyrmex echinatior]
MTTAGGRTATSRTELLLVVVVFSSDPQHACRATGAEDGGEVALRHSESPLFLGLESKRDAGEPSIIVHTTPVSPTNAKAETLGEILVGASPTLPLPGGEEDSA